MKVALKANRISIYFAVFAFVFFAEFFYKGNIFPAGADNENLTKYGVVFDDTNGSGTPNYARIIKKDGVYYMWYEDTTTDSFYYTTSDDGKNWAAGQETEATNVHEPSIIWDSDDSKYKMWFEPTIEELTGQIWYAESSNGLAWDEPHAVIWSDGVNDWENSGRYMPYVIKEDGEYKMWYQSLSDVTHEENDRRINYATSTDGIVWDNGGEFGQVAFGAEGDKNNNIVLGLGSDGSWDDTSLYSQAIIPLPAGADFNYAMFYAAHEGGRYKIGVAASDDGVSWMKESDYLISEEHDIWFPSIVEEENGFYIWYMDSAGGEVYFATLPFKNQLDNSENEKAHIDSWKAYQYEDPNKSCSSRLKLAIKGKHFNKDAEVKIGSHKASSVDKKSSKKITAKFCLNKLLDNQASKKRTISVTNPNADKANANKKIDLNNINFKILAGNLDPQTFEGIKNIQRALAELGYLDSQYITGFYGSLTIEAVKKFQGDNGIEQTGYVGPLTKAKLEEKMK